MCSGLIVSSFFISFLSCQGEVILCAFPPAQIFFHASCFHNKVCLLYSPSLGEAIQMKAGSFKPVSTHSFLPVPLCSSLLCSYTPMFGCWQTPPEGSQALSGSLHWDGSVCLQLAVRASLGHPVSVDATQSCFSSLRASECAGKLPALLW